MEQSLSYKWITFPYLSPGKEGARKTEVKDRETKQKPKPEKKKTYPIFFRLFLFESSMILQPPTELITMQGSHLVNKIIRV